MKFNHLVLLIAGAASFLSLPATAQRQAEPEVIEIEDLSDPGNPLPISGRVRVREVVSDGENGRSVRTLVTSEEIVGTNRSGKTILTVVLWVDLKPTHTANSRSIRQVECFFAPDVIKPGESHSFSTSRLRETSEPYSPTASASPPHLQARVVYVQYLDGSEFGSPLHAEHIFSIRRITWQHLRRLERAYRRSGEAGFAEELSESVEPGEVEVFFENIRRTLRSHGAQRALARVREALNWAEDRTAEFGKGANSDHLE